MMKYIIGAFILLILTWNLVFPGWIFLAIMAFFIFIPGMMGLLGDWINDQWNKSN